MQGIYATVQLLSSIVQNRYGKHLHRYMSAPLFMTLCISGLVALDEKPVDVLHLTVLGDPTELSIFTVKLQATKRASPGNEC